MSFVVPAALAIGLLIAAPLIAHLLRRGRAKQVPFPPAHLVPAARSLAKQRSRLEDWLLFALRGAMVLLFALLGATPLVRCSRLSLARSAGASVALAIVMDDSLSMRARLPNGVTRWERARQAALELVGSTRRGDAVGIVLAGKPARVALAPTTDLDAARRLLSELKVSDRSTDLDGASQIARTALAGLPQRDRQLVVFSDFAGEPPVPGEPPAWAPLAELTSPARTCGVVSAERRGAAISASVACNGASAAQNRQLEALDVDALGPDAGRAAVVASVALAARPGVQTLSIPIPSGRDVRGVRLSGKDDLAEDDAGSVATESLVLEIGVNADPARSAVTTGGPSLVEQALSALGGDIAVRPLSVLPDDPAVLSRYSALILDDPGGLGPEVRTALAAWVSRGGVIAALLGPRAESAVIGASLEPFAEGALRWEATHAKGLTTSSVDWLGPEARSLAELSPRGRVRLDGALASGARVVGRWDDGAAFIVQRELGRGSVLTVGLSSSADDSDFALRPGFLALLEHIVVLAREHSGLRRGTPGMPFRFPATTHVEVRAPDGHALRAEVEGSPAERVQAFIPEVAGRYHVHGPDGDEERLVAVEADEILAMPRTPPPSRGAAALSGRRRDIDASPEVARFGAALIALEIVIRLARYARRRARAQSVPEVSPQASGEPG